MDIDASGAPLSGDARHESEEGWREISLASGIDFTRDEALFGDSDEGILISTARRSASSSARAGGARSPSKGRSSKASSRRSSKTGRAS